MALTTQARRVDLPVRLLLATGVALSAGLTLAAVPTMITPPRPVVQEAPAPVAPTVTTEQVAPGTPSSLEPISSAPQSATLVPSEPATETPVHVTINETRPMVVNSVPAVTPTVAEPTNEPTIQTPLPQVTPSIPPTAYWQG